MALRISRVIAAAAGVGVGLVLVVSGPLAQQNAHPSLANGEWPSYGADLRNTHYSPLAQIGRFSYKAQNVIEK